MKGKIIAAGELRMEEGYEVTGVLVEVSKEELQAHVGNMIYQDVIVQKIEKKHGDEKE